MGAALCHRASSKMPPSLREWLPEDHLAYFVSDVVDQLDPSAIELVYEEDERGQPPYHRDDQSAAVWLLRGGLFLAQDAEAFGGGCGLPGVGRGDQPDFRTLSDFWKKHLGALEELFRQVLRLTLETR
jgi:hypothetical protein